MANSTEELRAEIMAVMQAAMSQAKSVSVAKMRTAMAQYESGERKIYQNTGAILQTPKIDNETMDAYSISYEAFLDESYTYPPGYQNDGATSMAVVLSRINSGSSPSWWTGTLQGPSGMPDLAITYAIQAASDAMSTYFG